METGGKPYELNHTLLDADTNFDSDIEEWSLENPHMYTVRSELSIDGIVVDSEDTRIGFRTIEFTTDKGFFLNEQHVKLNGVCLHHDLGGLGSAVYSDAIRRQLITLKAMGVNALRTAHNPPAKIFMELVDEMGFVVMSEISDTHTDAESGAKTLRLLMELVKKHDPKGHGAITFCSNYMPWENTQKCADIIKIIGYNYAESFYKKHHKEHPDWIIYGGETCSTVQSRGVYHFPLSKSLLSDDDLQCSALGNSTTSWGAKSVEESIIADRDTPFSMGQFVWAGQDYIGEPTPYHTKNSYLGHIDTAGFPKDSYYLFQAAWTDFEKVPMVHLFPYWDFSNGQIIDVRVCSNTPSVELFLNDKSLGVSKLGDIFIADWQIPYERGTLRAVAHNEAGKTIAEHTRHSFTDAVSLQTHTEVIGELSFVTITALDGEGHTVENANCRVRVMVGNGTLLALDNGDSTDYDQYQSDTRRLFAGKLLAIVHTDGNITPRVLATIDNSDMFIRKIELTELDYKVTAKFFPENATYDDLFWRLTDASGIDSPLGSLHVEEDGKSATVIPRGDGEMYVRCAAKNGRDHTSLFSLLAITVKGMGKPFLNPYTFVSAGLCNYSNVELTSGNERGIATLRDRDTIVGFKDFDFGDYGSDELTISLFPLEKEPFTFEIWEGIPAENGTRLTTAHYDKGSIWNTYQEVTYTLPRRLRGVKTLCLIFRQKVHVKGFIFVQYQKAFQKILATEYSTIYGDSFTVTESTVENIGNNVSIVFENMDFLNTGTNQVELCWRSDIAKNSILFIFSDEIDETRTMIVVDGSADYTSAVFPLNGTIVGKKKLTLSFLPGCKLDLAWFHFQNLTS